MKSLIAANIKHRHTMLNKLLFICPAVTAIFAFLSSGIMLFQSIAYYWWYLFVMQGIIAIFCYSVIRADEISGNSQIVYSLPVNLKKIRCADTAVITLKFSISSMLYMVLVYLIPFFLFPDYAIYSFGKLLIATVTIIATSLWQIPMCFILIRFIGRFLTIGLNVGAGIILISAFGNTGLWILFPHCWCAKAMEQILNIGSNGVIIENAAAFSSASVIAIILSITLFGLLTTFDAIVYERKTNK